MRGHFSVRGVLLALFALTVYANDQILSLPGFYGKINFNQYAGYINVNEETGRNLFYWFTESQGNPATDPIILWLNGGPGCSSLSGLFEELGPFTPVQNAGGEIVLAANPYSWNTVANVVFLESPSGVGFSYSTNTSDYTVGDARTANDTYAFLLSFFNQYPQFSKNPFWITGESYGGHYIPTLTQRILTGNKVNPQKLNFKGFMVGNPFTDFNIDSWGTIYQWYTHALISEETYENVMKACDFFGNGGNSTLCDQYQNDASNEVGNIDLYDIYTDVCLTNSTNFRLHFMEQLANSGYPLSKIAANVAGSGMAACEDNWLTTYLNQAEVQTAIHVTTPIVWTGCTNNLNYSVEDITTSMIPYYREFLPLGFDIIVYSGDVDSVVPFPGTRVWLDILNLTITEPWRPWTDSAGQVGGYTVGYQGLRFLTIRNAGHLVPGTQPLRALDFFARLLQGKPL